MKRVLVLNYEFPPLGGGAGNATYYLLKEFAKYPDLEIDLVTSSVDTFRVEKFAGNITIHFLNIGKRGNLHYQTNQKLLMYSWKSYWYSKKLMEEKEYDLCHAFFGIPCGYVAMMLRLPYIVSLRGSDVPFYNKRFYWLDKLVFKRLSRKIWCSAQAVVANSQKLKKLALESAPKQSMSIIPNGVDTEQFKPLPNGVLHKPLRLISTGRLIERKGYRYLIEAISEMKDVELSLVGDGNLRQQLEELAKILSVKVKFLGSKRHEEIVSLLQSADVFILPSLNEGMSNSILEAMACGLPIIATDTGGSSELIQGNGVIVAKADADTLRKAIVQLQSDPSLVGTMGRRSRELAEKMDWLLMSESYKKTYELA